MNMYLAEVIQHLPTAKYRGGRPSQPAVIAVEGITTDPASVRPGVLFVATPEGRLRNPFQAHAAARRGAAAVICDSKESRDGATPAIEVTDTLAAYDRLASLFHGDPASKLFHFIVTGGERRVAAAHFLHQLIEAAGHRAALLGSRSCVIDGRELPSAASSLNSGEFHRLLAAHLRSGGRACIFETPTEAAPASVPPSITIRVRLTDRPGAGTALRSVRGSIKGTQIMVSTGTTRQTLTVSLVGDGNIAALASAFDAALQAGASPVSLLEALPTLTPLPGVMQRVDRNGPFAVFVDSASTPESLASVLRELRLLTSGRVIVVTGVRPTHASSARIEMGRSAALADFAIFTADDPGYESVIELSRPALAALSPGEYQVEPNRSAAIRSAFAAAHTGDIVVLAGKGLSRTQDCEGAIMPWNESQTAARILAGMNARI